MTDDLRQRYAEAIAAKFTYPDYRCDRDGENERVEKPDPADRIDQTPYVMVTAGDGCRSFWTPSCAELGEVVAAVRDEELERLREHAETAWATMKAVCSEDGLRRLQVDLSQQAAKGADQDAQAWRERAEKAEAAIARVRQEHAEILAEANRFALTHESECECETVPVTRETADRMLAALDDTEETGRHVEP